MLYGYPARAHLCKYKNYSVQLLEYPVLLLLLCNYTGWRKMALAMLILCTILDKTNLSLGYIIVQKDNHAIAAVTL